MKWWTQLLNPVKRARLVERGRRRGRDFWERVRIYLDMARVVTPIDPTTALLLIRCKKVSLCAANNADLRALYQFILTSYFFVSYSELYLWILSRKALIHIRGNYSFLLFFARAAKAVEDES